MRTGGRRVRRFAIGEVERWLADDGGPASFGDVLGEEADASMGVTFIRWGAGYSGEFPIPLPYDELFVVTKGSYTVVADGVSTTAHAGEVLYLCAGTTGVYRADEDAELVAVTVPPYRRALSDSGHADQLEGLRDIET